MKEEEYLQRIDRLDKDDTEQARMFDKTIITLSSGFFALTLTFVKTIIPEIKSGTENLMLKAWWGFGACIFITLLSFLTSQFALKKEMRIVDNEYKKKGDNLVNYFTGITLFLNWCSIIAFVIGLLYWGRFVFNNVK